MRKTNTLTRCGTTAFVFAAIGVTTPILSTANAEPILTAVQESLAEVHGPIVDPFVVAAPAVSTLEIEKYAEAPKEPAPELASISSQTNLKPIRLRMKLDATTAQVAEVETHRQAAVDGDKNAIKQIEDSMSKATYKNRFQVSISDAGKAVVEVSQGVGGWPGYFGANTGWTERPLSVDMRRGLKDIIKKCSSASGPMYFNANMLEGDGDIGKGQFEVGCVPGSEVIRNQVTSVDLAHAYLTSDDLPLEQRQDYFQWKFGFAMMVEYVKNTPDATFADDRAACARMFTEQKEKYAFTDKHREASDGRLSKCGEGDFNWVRRRNNVAEITQ